MGAARHLAAAARAAAKLGRGPGGPGEVRFAFPDIGAPARYRVAHQVEQARIAGLRASAAPLDDPDRLYDLAGASLLVLYRTPLAPRSLALLALARARRIPVAFDSDDLTWGRGQREDEFLDRHYDRATVARIGRTARGTAALMRRADALILSTPFLARLAAEASGRPAFVNMNAVSREMAALSEAALAARPPRPEGELAVGYFSGHPRVHDEDLALAGPALAEALGRYPGMRLVLCGEVALPRELEPHAGRVERRPAVGWRELPAEIARVDVNIAPLLDNPQRRSKSAVKYLEAALVGVPTVGARLEPYADVIAEGRTGLLAGPHEWGAALAALAERPALRRELGAAARAHVLAEHTTDARAPHLAEVVGQITRGGRR